MNASTTSSPTTNMVKDIQETGYRARADRRLISGTVVAVDNLTNTCTLDCGVFDNNDNPIYMHDMPFNPHTTPSIGDVLQISYPTSSPHSAVISGGGLGGSNVGQTVVGTGVQSLNALAGAVLVAVAGTLSIAVAGQTITITGNPNVNSLNGLIGALSILGTGGIAITASGADVTVDGSGITGTGANGEPFGLVNKQSAPYVCSNSDTYVYVNGGSGNITLPLSTTFNGSAIVLRNGTTSTSFGVACQGSDVFDDSPPHPTPSLNARGSSSYIAYIFQTDKAGHWYAHGLN